MFIHSIVLKYINSNSIGLCKLLSYSNYTSLTITNIPQDVLNSKLCLCASIGKGYEKFYLLDVNQQNIYAQLNEIYDANCHIALINFYGNSFNVVASGANVIENYLPNYLQSNLSIFLPKIQQLFNYSNEDIASNLQVKNMEEKEPFSNDDGTMQENLLTESAQSTTQESAGPTFFSQIQKSIDALFKNNPHDEVLEKAIEHSKFAKISQDDTEHFHSVGIIFSKQDIEMPEYICFALPCTPSSPPPKDMEKYSQLIIIDNDVAYYLMYQHAQTGENIVLH